MSIRSLKILKGVVQATGLIAIMIGCIKSAEASEMHAGVTTAQEPAAADSAGEMMGAPGLAPFDLMTGKAGHWMISYQFMHESMDGNLNGTDEVSSAEILQDFFFAPRAMTMQTHMFMGMYAPTDKLTLMVMLPYIRKEMDMLAFDGERFSTHSDGIGDVELRGVYRLFETSDARHRFLLRGGIGLPTGSIDATMDGFQLEYPMQLGSGTFSLLPGLAYIGQCLPWGWGADFKSTIQLGTNDQDYRLGNRYQPSIWIARRLANWVSVSVGGTGEIWENVHGADRRLFISDQPTNDPNRQGGTRLDAILGLTFHPQYGFLRHHQLMVQGEIPIVQSLDGPQLQRSWGLRFAWYFQF